MLTENAKKSLGLLVRHGLTAWAGVMGWTWFTTGDVMDAVVTLAVSGVALGWSYLQKNDVVKA